MPQLTLTWDEAGQTHHHTIVAPDSPDPTFRVMLGRNPARCDLVLSDPTVSGLHVEIGFDWQRSVFFLANLRSTNPPLVEGFPLRQGETVLRSGMVVQLGCQKITIAAIQIATTASLTGSEAMPPQLPAYRLQCPQCQRIASYEHLDLGCPWCGTSLAGAASILLP